MGMLRPVARHSTATIAPLPRLRAATGPEVRVGCSCLRKGWALWSCDPSAAQLVSSETPDFAPACAKVPSRQRRVLDFACSAYRCQSASSARPPRVARPRGLAPPTSPESPPCLAARPGFAPPLGFYSPSKVILPPTRSGSRRGPASLRYRRFHRLRGVNGQLTMVSRGSPRVGSCLPTRQNPGLSPSIPLRGVLADPSGSDFAVAFRFAPPPTTPRKGRPVNEAAPGAEPRTFLGVS